MADQQSKGQGEGAMARTGSRGSLATRQFQDPFAWFDLMFDRMQRDFFGAPLLGGLFPEGAAEEDRPIRRVARMQMQDAGNAIAITAELPGVEPEDVKVELRDDVLYLQGESRHEEERDGGRIERQVSFYRQIPLPDNVDPDQAQASYRNGVLSIKLPKRAGRESVKQIPITTESRAQKPREKAA